MVSVTQRIAEVKQPRGGYLPIKQFNVIKLDDGIELKEENVSGSTVSLVVDCLTRLRPKHSNHPVKNISNFLPVVPGR